MLAQILTCIGASAAVFLTYTLLVVVQTEPWYSPQYFIPILGEIHPLLPLLRAIFFNLSCLSTDAAETHRCPLSTRLLWALLMPVLTQLMKTSLECRHDAGECNIWSVCGADCAP